MGNHLTSPPHSLRLSMFITWPVSLIQPEALSRRQFSEPHKRIYLSLSSADAAFGGHWKECACCYVLKTGQTSRMSPLLMYSSYCLFLANEYLQCKCNMARLGLFKNKKTQKPKTTMQPEVMFTVMSAVRRNVLSAIIIKLSRNHVNQITPLATPLFFMASFSLVSFSSTMLFTIMETE